MSFWQRMTRTLRADAHGVIDALEDRTLLLKQHLRDAELALQNKRARSQALDTERERLERELCRYQTESQAHERDAELAVQAGEDTLARYALQQWLSKQQLSERLTERLQVIASERRALDEALAQQEPDLAELRARVAAYLSEHAQQAEGEPSVLQPRPVAPELVELELLRRKHAQRQQAETEPEAEHETR